MVTQNHHTIEEKLNPEHMKLMLDAVKQRDAGLAVFSFVAQHLSELYKLNTTDIIDQNGVIRRNALTQAQDGIGTDSDVRAPDRIESVSTERDGADVS